MKFDNKYGGFSEDGREYVIKVNKKIKPPTVWSNVLANEKFGTVVTNNLGGFTYAKNSRLNRITAWVNSPVNDIPSEIIYLKNIDNDKMWTLNANVIPDDNDYDITYGFGYVKEHHISYGIIQDIDIFVPKDESVKINIIKLRNTIAKNKKIKLVYYLKPVLGEDETKTNGYINLEFDENKNILFAKNLYGDGLSKNVYVSSNEKIISYTGNNLSFIGNGGLNNPKGLKEKHLKMENALGVSSCIAIELEIDLKEYEEKKVVLLLGEEDKKETIEEISRKYQIMENAEKSYRDTQNNWNEILRKVQVRTGDEEIDFMLNGWLIYQTMVCRLYARSAYYQSGGAFGFRDQLQDSLSLKYVSPELLKNQILKHARHQFEEGDVEHWWHDETKRGIRTKFTDDLLWLVYCVCEYIEFTGDYSLLEIEVPYISGNILADNEDEKYDVYEQSELKESIYKHCIRAIEKSLNFGDNGLPKIGSGDWNDGFSTVGNKGKGESVWLGFFLYNILDRFDKICEEIGKTEYLQKYESIKEKLKIVLNDKAWDGNWFKRAFMDDGEALGSNAGEECKIDSIAQSWAVISNAGDREKVYKAMESLEKYLIDRETGIIKLFDPPFEKSKLEPGYIKNYLPGTRENGGQYTHSAIWAIIAFAILGQNDKAYELYKMINPIEHSCTEEKAKKYKVEPYVIVADIYGASNLLGQGGWTWYTGSSSWYYMAGIKYILGIKIHKGVLSVKPCMPRNFKEYFVRYEYKSSVYNIKVKNTIYSGKVQKFIVDGSEIKDKCIKLIDNGKTHEIEVEM